MSVAGPGADVRGMRLTRSWHWSPIRPTVTAGRIVAYARWVAGASNRAKKPASTQERIAGRDRFMAVSIAVTSSLRRLRAVLFVAALHTSVAAAEGPTKGADFVRVVPEQLH